MMLILIVGVCLVGILLLTVLGLGIFLIMQAGERDAVSPARQDWIQRRSNKDEQEW
jgi:UPF0716 family protein affecting phage T7 exclusion